MLFTCSKCASVAAHFELKEVFDNLIISLCKFTSLLTNHEVWRGVSERGGEGEEKWGFAHGYSGGLNHVLLAT